MEILIPHSDCVTEQEINTHSGARVFEFVSFIFELYLLRPVRVTLRCMKDVLLAHETVSHCPHHDPPSAWKNDILG